MNLAGEKIVVIGGAGLVGSHVVDQLVDEPVGEIVVFDNLVRGTRRNLASALRSPKVTLVEGSITDTDALARVLSGAGGVFLLSALWLGECVAEPRSAIDVNILGTFNVLEASHRAGVRRVVFSSSTSVYGTSRELPTRESTPPDPISPYGVAKLAAERYCVSFSRVYHSFETVVLRYFNVYGPRQSPFSQYAAVVPLFVTAIDRGEPVTIYGDGEQSRDFTYVDNVVDATIRGAEAEGASGRIFNVAAGAPATVNHVADTIGAILGKPVERRFEPPRAGDIRDSWADISAARGTLGYEPRVDLTAGLELTVEAIVARV